MTIETIEVVETPYLYVDGEAPMDPALISREMDKAFTRLTAFLNAQKVTPEGSPMVVYHDYDPEKMVFRAAMHVSKTDACKAVGDVKADATPGGPVYTFTHIGPYSTLRDAYVAAESELAREGKILGIPTWEVYANDPARTRESELRTDVYSVVTAT
ncbi:MAG: GyrI-like domain-containing protein [Roseitalea sp.]|jgi:effector-binding domain-containing protein|nr:GyrI-like domain-containing protein [Roseitalea sp.]MBO6722199.1 GyrI-like domain-containing protein [Roseitalea sp.]MBO6745010.1 GyrI-like domain-containing protein [Roseitalea sp.]